MVPNRHNVANLAGALALGVALLVGAGPTAASSAFDVLALDSLFGRLSTPVTPQPHQPPAAPTGPADDGTGRAADDGTGRAADDGTGRAADDGTDTGAEVAGPTPDPGPTPGLAPAGAGEGSGVVRFVYFVEADQEFDPEAVAAIEAQAAALQRFWHEQFGGTFLLPEGGVDVVYGLHPATWYDTTPNGTDQRWYRLMNIRQEVHAALDIDAAAPSDRLVTYPNARIDGRVGANRYGGAWMDGDDLTCIGGTIATSPYSVDHPASCLGTVAHELGHVYGLSHTGADEDCMQLGFYRYVLGDAMCGFSAENRRAVLDDPANVGWLDASPGDRG